MEEDYKIKPKLLEYIIPNRISKLENQAKNKYKEDLNKWEIEYKYIEKENNQKTYIWEESKKAF